MLKDITSIKLQGANFRAATHLLLLGQNGTPVKASLLYGRNGTGKSTIARAFKKLKGETVPGIQFVTCYDIHEGATTIQEGEQSDIFVFDEDFVTENVRVDGDGLGSIVMLGEQAGLADKIATATTELQTAVTDRDQKKMMADAYVNNTSDKSPKYYIEKMKNALRGENNWAGRDKRIKGNVANTSVSEDTYKDFVDLAPEKTRDELIIDFESEWDNLKEAKSGVTKITATIPRVPEAYGLYETSVANAQLKKVIEHPELSEREQYLLELVQSGKGDDLRATAQEFQAQELIICPKCHQSLSTEYKSDLITSISKVLSEEVKKHQRKLGEFELPLLSLDLSAFQGLPHYQRSVEAIDSLNQLIQGNNTLLQKKKEDPYTPIEEDLANISDAITDVTTILQQLENEKAEHNRTVADTRPLKDKLTKINNEIAYYDVIEFSHKHDEMKAEKEIADAAYATAKRVAEEKQTCLNGLNAQRDSIHIAIDVINDGLKYIFFSDNRMKIQVENGKYKLLCNGHPVKPKDVSVGERNIIGLCYFFTSILEGKNSGTAFGEEYLLVIDDPVSSYDLENKVGIISFMKYQLGKFLLGNIETRALIMTHDLLTAVDVEKMLVELMKECTIRFNGQRGFSYAPYELCDCKIKRFENKRNEYTELLGLVYEYGNGAANEQGPYIGNIMRQVMEAFATFEYKKSIDAISTDDEILSVMEHEEDRIHYKNLMYRIVLNEGSHRYDQTRNMQVDFLSLISEQDRRRTAKEILCFMYLLNKPHIKAHLGHKNCATIESWCNDTRIS